MNSKEVKNTLRMENIPYWRLAKAMSVSENTVYRMLRENELSKDSEERITKAIDAVRKEQNND